MVFSKIQTLIGSLRYSTHIQNHRLCRLYSCLSTTKFFHQIQREIQACVYASRTIETTVIDAHPILS